MNEGKEIVSRADTYRDFLAATMISRNGLKLLGDAFIALARPCPKEMHYLAPVE